MSIDYQVLIDEAMLSIVKKVLVHTQNNGLKENQCFYITFKTNYPEVKLSKSILARYPKEITIVLQHQYRDLRVLNDRFSVNIAFNGLSETIIVPFLSLTAFSDPSVNFSLQFQQDVSGEMDEDLVYESSELVKLQPKKSKSENVITTKAPKSSGEVVSIDKFRKK